MAPRARSASRSRGLPWQPRQPQRHMKPRSILGERSFNSSMPAFRSAAGCFKPSTYAPIARAPAAAAVLRPFDSHLSMSRLWQPAPPGPHGCRHEHTWPVQHYQHQRLLQQQKQQQLVATQLKKRTRRARQRRQRRQRRALARQQQKQQPALFAPPAPLLDNEFYMARAERERQEQGVRQMDFFLYPAAAAAGAGDHQPAVMFAPAAPFINNEMLAARAEQERAEAAVVQQQQQQAGSSALFAPLTPAAQEQPLAASQAVAAAAVAAPVALPTEQQLEQPQLQQLEQQLQQVHIQELSCSQQQQQDSADDEEEEQQQHDDDDFTMEEVCSWYPAVQASLKSTQRVSLPAEVAGRQPDAPGFFSVLTRTVSDADSCC